MLWDQVGYEYVNAHLQATSLEGHLSVLCLVLEIPQFWNLNDVVLYEAWPTILCMSIS
jgi:hypothetical protein